MRQYNSFKDAYKTDSTVCLLDNPAGGFRKTPLIPSGGAVAPDTWGPLMWYTLHNGAYHYPERASAVKAVGMKHFILGLPHILPCAACAQHAERYIQSRTHELDRIVSGRRNLFQFFCDFHNIVNKRFGKPQISLRDAYKIYSQTP